MPLFGPPNVEKLKTEGNVKGLTRALRYKKNWRIRIAAAKALGEIGDAQAVEPLIAVALKDWKSVTVRRAAVKALGRIGAPAAESLSAALKDLHGETLRAAFELLERYSWRPDRNEIGAAYWIMKRRWDKCVEIGAPAVDPLIGCLSDRDLYGGAAKALIEIGIPAVKPLIAAFKSQSGERSLRASWILRDIGTPAVEPLVALLGDSNEKMRRHAIRILEEIGDPRAAPPLVVVLKSPDKETYRAAVRALAKIGPEEYSTLAETLDLLDKRNRVATSLDEWTEGTRRAEASLERWREASDPVAVGYIQTALEGADKAAVKKELAALNRELQRRKIKLEVFISRSTDRKYISYARETLMKL